MRLHWCVDCMSFYVPCLRLCCLRCAFVIKHLRFAMAAEVVAVVSAPKLSAAKSFFERREAQPLQELLAKDLGCAVEVEFASFGRCKMSFTDGVVPWDAVRANFDVVHEEPIAVDVQEAGLSSLQQRKQRRLARQQANRSLLASASASSTGLLSGGKACEDQTLHFSLEQPEAVAVGVSLEDLNEALSAESCMAGLGVQLRAAGGQAYSCQVAGVIGGRIEEIKGALAKVFKKVSFVDDAKRASNKRSAQQKAREEKNADAMIDAQMTSMGKVMEALVASGAGDPDLVRSLALKYDGHLNKKQAVVTRGDQHRAAKKVKTEEIGIS